MSKIYEALKQAEQDRNDAQRKALSTLLARFTADRDALMAAIQDCQQQLATLADRVERAPSSASEDLSQTVARLVQEQQRLAAALPAGDLLTAVDRLAADRDRQVAEVRRYGDELAAGLERLKALQAGVVSLPQQLDDLRARQAFHEAHVEATAQEASNAAEAIRRQMADLPDPAALERIRVEQELMSGALRALQDHMVNLGSQLHSLEAAAGARAQEVRAQIDELVQLQSTANRVTPVDLEAVLGQLRAMQQRVEELGAELQTLASTSAASHVEPLTAEIEQCRADLQAFGQRFDEMDLGSLPQLEGLRQQMARLQEGQESLQRDTHAALLDALRQSQENAERMDALACDAARGGELVDVVRRLALEEQGTRASLQSSEQRLQELIGRIEAAQRAVLPQIDSLRSQIDAMQGSLAQAERSAESAAAAALTRAQEALRRIDGLVESERALQDQGARVGQLSEAQEALAATVAQYRAEVGIAIARLESANREQVESFERRLSERRDAEDAAGAEAVGIAQRALTQAREALGRAEQAAAAHEVHRGDVEQRLLQLLEARDAVQETTAQLAEHVRALTVHLAEAPTVGVTAEVIQQTIEQLQQAQRQTEAQTKQASVKLRHDLDELSHRLDTLSAKDSSREQRLETLSSALAEAQRNAEQGLAAGLASQTQRLEANDRRLESLQRSSDEGLAALRAQLSEWQSEQGTAVERLAITVASLEAALGQLRKRFDEVAANREEDRDSLASAAAGLRAEVRSSLQEWQERLAEMSRDTQAVLGSQAPALAEARSAVDELRVLHEQSSGEIRTIAESARARAADALQRIQEVARRQQTSEESSEARLVAQAQTEAVVRRCEADIASLAAELQSQAQGLSATLDFRWNELNKAVLGLTARLTAAEGSLSEERLCRSEEVANLRRVLDTQVVDPASRASEARIGQIEARLQSAADTGDERWEELRLALDSLAVRLNALEGNRSDADDRWQVAVAALREQMDAQIGQLGRVASGHQQLLDEQSRLRALIEQALGAQAKAEDALRRIEVLDGAHAASLDVLRRQIAGLQEEDGALRTALASLPPAEIPVADDELRAEIAALRREDAERAAQIEAKLLATANQAATLEQDVQRLGEERQRRDRELSAVLTGLADEREAVNLAIRGQAAELTRLVGSLSEARGSDPSVIALQNEVSELAAALAAMRQAHGAWENRSAQLDAALGERAAAVHGEINDLRAEVARVATHLEEGAATARRHVVSLQTAMQQEREDRLTAEAQTSSSLQTLSERVTEAIQAMERAATQAAAMRPIPAAATPVEAIVDGFGRLEARLDQWLGSGAAVRSRPPIVPQRAQWPLWLLAACGVLTTLSGLFLLLVRNPMAPAPTAPRSVSSASEDPAVAAQFARGLEALQRGEVEAAERAFRAVIAIRPDGVEARNNLAVVLAEQRRMDAAIEELREALRLQPEYERARSNLSRIERLRDSSSQAHASAPLSGQPLAEARPEPEPVQGKSSGQAQQPLASDSAVGVEPSTTGNGTGGCVLQAQQQRVCCGAGAGETCFALAPTPARPTRREAKPKARAQVDVDDLDLLYDLP